jgi:hypothetical protein
VTKILNTVLHAHGGMGYQVKGGTAVDETFFGIIYTLDSDYAPDVRRTIGAREGRRGEEAGPAEGRVGRRGDVAEGEPDAVREACRRVRQHAARGPALGGAEGAHDAVGAGRVPHQALQRVAERGHGLDGHARLERVRRSRPRRARVQGRGLHDRPRRRVQDGHLREREAVRA